MSKKDFIERIVSEFNVNKSQADNMYDIFLDELQGQITSLKSGESFQLFGIGVFKVKDTPSRTGRNPRTGESLEIPAGKRITFKASSRVKNAIK